MSVLILRKQVVWYYHPIVRVHLVYCLKQLQWVVVGLPLQPMLQGTGRLLTIEKTDFFVSQKAPLIKVKQ